MAVAVNKHGKASSDTAANSFAVSWTGGGNSGAGDCLVAIVSWFNSGGATTDLTSFSDGTNSYTIVKTLDFGGSGVFAALGVAKNAGAIATITAHFSSSAPAFFRGLILDASGADTVNPANATDSHYQAAPGTAANAVTSQSGTTATTVDGCLVVGGVFDISLNVAPSVGTSPLSFTLQESMTSPDNDGELLETATQTTHGTVAATAKLTTGTDNVGTLMVAIAPPTAGPANYYSDISSNRNRPGRGPFSIGRFFVESIDAFTTPASQALVGTTGLVFGQTGNLTGTGALAGTSALTFNETGALTGSGALAGTSGLVIGETGALTGAGALAGTSGLVIGETGTLQGAGALTGESDLVFGTSGTLTPPSGAMTGTSALTVGATGALAGAGALVGESDLVFGASATLTQPGAMQGTAAITMGSSGALSGFGALVGTCQIVLGASGTSPVGSAAGKHRRRRFGVFDGDRLLAFDTRGEAEQAKAAIAARDLPKPRNARKVKIKPLPPAQEIIPLPQIAAVAQSMGESGQYEQLLADQASNRLLDFYVALRAREEEEAALSLLHLDREERLAHSAHLTHAVELLYQYLRNRQ
jgi:hypothetical protein